MPVIQGVFISTPERRRREHLPTIDLDLRKDPRKARFGKILNYKIGPPRATSARALFVLTRRGEKNPRDKPAQEVTDDDIHSSVVGNGESGSQIAARLGLKREPMGIE